MFRADSAESRLIRSWIRRVDRVNSDSRASQSLLSWVDRLGTRTRLGAGRDGYDSADSSPTRPSLWTMPQEKKRAAAMAMNAEIQRTKARLMEEVPTLQRLTLKKVWFFLFFHRCFNFFDFVFVWIIRLKFYAMHLRGYMNNAVFVLTNDFSFSISILLSKTMKWSKHRS